MSTEYDIYLEEHRKNVQKGFEWLATYLPELLMTDEYRYDNILNHDTSKFDPEEYEAYDRYFYGRSRSYQVVQDFNNAWLHHIHHNPHHWQHWVLINDEPGEGIKPLDIPYPYIIEMICDWWSFSWKTGNLYIIFDWYDDHKLYMIMTDGVRGIVEYILDEIHAKLLELQREKDELVKDDE